MKKIITSLAVGCILISGCSPNYYIPNTQNVPLISEKGETNITIATVQNQVDFQGAYGLTDKIALQANGSVFFNKNDEEGDGGSGKYFEVGGGYFKPIANGYVFETYGIIGLGSMENHFPSSISNNPQTTGDISANMMRFGIQPSFGYKSRYFSASVSSRIVNLSYSNIKGNLTFAGESQINYLNANKSNFLLEPALTLRGGLDKIKLQVQIGSSINLSNDDFRQDNNYATIGLNFNLK